MQRMFHVLCTSDMLCVTFQLALLDCPTVLSPGPGRTGCWTLKLHLKRSGPTCRGAASHHGCCAHHTCTSCPFPSCSKWANSGMPWPWPPCRSSVEAGSLHAWNQSCSNCSKQMNGMVHGTFHPMMWLGGKSIQIYYLPLTSLQ